HRTDDAARHRVAGDDPLDLEQVLAGGGAHAGSSTATRSLRWQIASCPGSISSRRGWVTVHGAKVESQRGANGQPTSSRARRGGAPGIDLTSSSPSRSGVAENSIRV